MPDAKRTSFHHHAPMDDRLIPLFSSCPVTVFPGFCDVHVHFREPGFSYKETIRTASRAAARGGYTDVCAMPHLYPVPDSRAHLEEELALIRRDACIHVHPYGAITVGQKGEALADLAGMAKDVIAFSDDGHGVQSDDRMQEAMQQCKALGKMIVAHCEVNSLLHGGVIHAGAWARDHGLPGIASESEWRQIERDIRLSADTGCAYHVCHISCRESVQIIRDAKKSGVNVTCETAPHYLVLDDSHLEDLGKWKMNPPLRSPDDREALLEGLADGTIDMIATDHAPHSAEEKSRGLRGSSFGIVGIETAFPVLYTFLVKPGLLSLEQLLQAITVRPRRRFQIAQEENSYTLWDLTRSYTIDPKDFLSMGKSTPFEGMQVFGSCLATVCNGKLVYTAPETGIRL